MNIEVIGGVCKGGSLKRSQGKIKKTELQISEILDIKVRTRGHSVPFS